jgi:hypothetical protein
MIGKINGTHSSPIHPILQILEKPQPQIYRGGTVILTE